MENRIELNQEAVQDLAKEAQAALEAFMTSKSDTDLTSLVKITLADFVDDYDPDSINDATNFLTGLGLDSLAITEFIFFFEDIFNLKISNEALTQLQTVGDIKRFILDRID